MFRSNVHTCYKEENRGKCQEVKVDKRSFSNKGTFKHKHPANGSRNRERMAEARIVFLCVSGPIPVSVRETRYGVHPGLLEAQVGKQDWADTWV